MSVRGDLRVVGAPVRSAVPAGARARRARWLVVTVALAVAGAAVALLARLLADAGPDGTRASWALLAASAATCAGLVLLAIRERWVGDTGRARLAWVLGGSAAAPVLGGVVLAAVLVPAVHGPLDAGFLLGTPLFAAAALLLPTPRTQDRWETTLDVMDGVTAALGTAVATLWMLPDDVGHGLDLEESVHITAVTLTVGAVVFVVARQRRPGGVPVRQLELLVVGALLIVAGYVNNYRTDVDQSYVGFALSGLLFVLGVAVAGWAVAGPATELEGPAQLRRREVWATFLPVIPVAAGMIAVAWYATQPVPLPFVVGTPMVVLVYLLVALFLIARVLLEQQARRMRQSAAQLELDAVLEDRWFRTLVGDSADVVVLLDPDGSVRYASPAAERLLATSATALRGEPFSHLVAGEEQVARGVLAEAARDPERAHPLSVVLRSRSGALTPAEGVVSALAGVAGGHGYVVSLRDVSDVHALSQRLQSESRTDALTGLPNRSGFLAECDRRAAEGPGSVRHVIVALDVNRFGLVNDARGHQSGDALLQALAAAVVASAPPGSAVGRVGGDEFGVLLVGPAASQHQRVQGFVAALEPRLAELSSLRGDGLPMACHVGYAVASYPGEPAGTVLRHAQVAQGAARVHGGPDPVRYDADSHAAALAAAGLEAELGRATELGQLELYYQPLVRLSDGAVAGAEALLRWHHPELGLLAPDRFVPLAEASGLIVPIGRWVREQAARDLVALGTEVADTFRVGVNVSPAEISLGLAADLVAAVREAGADPRRVVVEVTESAVFQRLAVATEVIEALRGEGVPVALDDFGTGYSSLSLVTDLSIDVLKIDRSFVQEMATSAHALALVRSVLQLAESMRLSTTAEGVENAAEARLLQAMGCEQAQGYLYGRPMPLAELRRWLAAR